MGLKGQKKDSNILKSTDIKEIEFYLQQTHPDDPKKIVLKKKLITLKNADWVKGAKTAKPMEARNDESGSITESESSGLEELFKRQMALEDHKEKTTQLLNTMFDNDPYGNQTILLINNKTQCNIVVKLKGNTEYALPVPKNSNNTLVLEKGKYAISSNLCGNIYHSDKNISQKIAIDLQIKQPK